MTTPGGYNTGTASSGGAAQLLVPQAATPLAGVALVNGTPTILSWTAPNDGKPHYFQVIASMDVSVLQVGGAVGVAFTTPDQGSNANNAFPGLFTGAQAAGFNYNQVYSLSGVVKPGSTVSVMQTSALTSGAAVMWATILGY
jgi:predicted RecA/RadA family phage recombinase